jgi:hypothetical protein
MHQLLKTVAGVQLGPNRRKSKRFLLGFGATKIWTKDSRDFPMGCGLFGLTRSLREISEQPGQVTGAMHHPDDYRRIAIRGVDDQVWIAG